MREISDDSMCGGSTGPVVSGSIGNTRKNEPKKKGACFWDRYFEEELPCQFCCHNSEVSGIQKHARFCPTRAKGHEDHA